MIPMELRHYVFLINRTVAGNWPGIVPPPLTKAGFAGSLVLI